MTFSAPKWVSALWAVGSPYERARIEAAHTRAVAGAIARIERDVELVRAREGGKARSGSSAERLLAAEFVHTSSRLTRDQERGGVPDPQLHSHVWCSAPSATDGTLRRGRLARAVPRARGQTARGIARSSHTTSSSSGLQIEGGTGRDGRYFEVKGVPQDADGALVGTRGGHRAGGTRVPHPLRPRPPRRRAGFDHPAPAARRRRRKPQTSTRHGRRSARSTA